MAFFRVFLVYTFLHWLIRALWLFYYEDLRFLSFKELLWALWAGLRFDFATFCALVAIPLVLCFFFFFFIRRWLWLFFLLLSLGFNLADVAYYQHGTKRLSYEVLTLFTNPSAFKDVWKEYLVLTLWFLLLSVLFLWWNNKLWRMKSNVSWWQFLFYIAIIVVGLRGLDYKPLSPSYAFQKVEHSIAGHWALNTLYTMGNAWVNKTFLQLYHWVEDSTAITALQQCSFSPSYDSVFISASYPLLRSTKKQTFRPLNVVMIVLESFTAQYADSIKGLAPFYQQLKQKSLVFPRYYSNAIRSIEALPSIVAGVPHLSDFSVIGSILETHTGADLPFLLRRKGYHTSFFLGARKGTLGFASFMKAHGIQHYFSQEDYLKKHPKSHYDGYWGIYDHYFFHFFFQKLKQFPEPFFSVFFSLSNHHPFKLPVSFSVKPFKNNYFNTFHYTDWALRQFFSWIAQDTSKRWERTLFVITADHTYVNWDVPLRDVFQHSRVPLLLYCPKYIAPGVCWHVGSHTALTPTILHFLGWQGNYTALNASLLDSTANHEVLIYRGSGHYLYLNDTIAWEIHGDTTCYLWSYQQKRWVKQLLNKKLPKRFYALLQGQWNLWIRNRLFSHTNK